jgi:hypothetical protein
MRWAFWRRSSPLLNPAQNAITGNFNLTAQLAGQSGRTMSIAGYIYDGESQESLNARLDILQEVVERQRVRCEIPELEAKREQMIKGLQQARDVLSEIEQKQESGSITSQERMNLKNMRVNIGKVNEELQKGEEAIREAKQKAGVG